MMACAGETVHHGSQYIEQITQYKTEAILVWYSMKLSDFPVDTNIYIRSIVCLICNYWL